MRCSPELHLMQQAETRRVIKLRASMLTGMAGIVVMMGLAPVALVMVIAGMGGQ